MIVRVNVNTEAGGQSYLVETEDIENENVREVIEFIVDNPDFSSKKSFGDFLTVVYGEIIQDGYVLSNALQKVSLEEEVPQIPVITNI